MVHCLLDPLGVVRALDERVADGYIILTPQFHGTGSYALYRGRNEVWPVMFDTESERRVGSLKTASFPTDEGDYEQITLKIRRPLQLKGGKVLPPCKIHVAAETEDSVAWGYRRERGLWLRAIPDLSELLPDEAFLMSRITLERIR